MDKFKNPIILIISQTAYNGKFQLQANDNDDIIAD